MEMGALSGHRRAFYGRRVFFSSWQALRATEARFCQTLDFVKSQSTSFEKHNDTVVAKALRRAAVSVHQLAQAPALDLSDPQCLNRQAELLWLTGISVLSPDGTLLCESTTNGIGYAQFGEQLKNDAVLDVFSYPQKTYLKRVLLEDGSAVDVAAHRAESKEVILLAYRYTPAEFVEGTALSIQSVLDGYSVETSGTLFIVQNNQVIASNRPELIGQNAADSPPVQEIRKAGAAETRPIPTIGTAPAAMLECTATEGLSISTRIRMKNPSSVNRFR